MKNAFCRFYFEYSLIIFFSQSEAFIKRVCGSLVSSSSCFSSLINGTRPAYQNDSACTSPAICSVCILDSTSVTIQRQELRVYSIC